MTGTTEADWHGLTVTGTLSREGVETFIDDVKVEWPEGLPEEFRDFIEGHHLDDIHDALTEAWEDDEREQGMEYTGEEDL